MAIQECAAMTGKVFSAARDSLVLHSLEKGDAVLRDHRRARMKTAALKRWMVLEFI